MPMCGRSPVVRHQCPLDGVETLWMSSTTGRAGQSILRKLETMALAEPPVFLVVLADADARQEIQRTQSSVAVIGKG